MTRSTPSPLHRESLSDSKSTQQASVSSSKSLDSAGSQLGPDGSLGNSNIKRRSLSETSVDKAAQLEQQESQQQLLAKVARLEVKSPTVVNISSSFRSPTFQKPSDLDPSSISPHLSVSSRQANSNVSPKKSRSSENISSSGLSPGLSKIRSPPGPFSFSLTTPTSNLSSFKFMEKPSGGLGISVNDQMPDFSVFDKVPTPTEELPPSRSFVFVGKPHTDSVKLPTPSKNEFSSAATQNGQQHGTYQNKFSNPLKKQFTGHHRETLEEDVWSRRSDPPADVLL